MAYLWLLSVQRRKGQCRSHWWWKSWTSMTVHFLVKCLQKFVQLFTVSRSTFELCIFTFERKLSRMIFESSSARILILWNMRLRTTLDLFYHVTSFFGWILQPLVIADSCVNGLSCVRSKCEEDTTVWRTPVTHEPTFSVGSRCLEETPVQRTVVLKAHCILSGNKEATVASTKQCYHWV